VSVAVTVAVAVAVAVTVAVTVTASVTVAVTVAVTAPVAVSMHAGNTAHRGVPSLEFFFARALTVHSRSEKLLGGQPSR